MAVFPDIQPPQVKTIIKTFRKFVNEGTCIDLNKGRSDRRRSATSQENVDRVRQSLENDGLRSSRRNGLGLSQSSFVRIVNRLNYHPYVLIRRHKLKPGDPAQRMTFCNWFLESVRDNDNFLSQLIVSDEAIFSLNTVIYNIHGLTLCYVLFS